MRAFVKIGVGMGLSPHPSLRTGRAELPHPSLQSARPRIGGTAPLSRASQPIQAGNLGTLARAGLRNRALVSHLFGQALQGMGDWLGALRRFYPLARDADWRQVEADVALHVIRRCLPDLVQAREGRAALGRMMPTHDVDLKDPAHARLLERQHRRTAEVLGLAGDAPARAAPEAVEAGTDAPGVRGRSDA